MSIKAAVDALCDLTVTGVTVYDLAALPGAVVTLPCLIPQLNFSRHGLEYFTTAEDGVVTMEIEHVLLVAGLQQGLAATRNYSVLAHVDNYIAALKADWRLNDTLIKPLRIIGINWSPQTWAGVLYIGCAFRHEWQVFFD